MTHKSRLRTFALACALALLGVHDWVSLALANGGVTQVSRARVGPYVVSVSTSPSPIRVGPVDVSVTVEQPGSLDFVLDAKVLVTVESLTQPGQILTFEATHERATNKLLYAADVRLAATGQWRIGVQVSGAAGQGNTEFMIEASEASLLDAPLFRIAMLFVVSFVVLLWLRLRAPRRAARTVHQPPPRRKRR